MDSLNKCHYNVFMLQILCVSNYWQWIWMRNWISLSVTFHYSPKWWLYIKAFKNYIIVCVVGYKGSYIHRITWFWLFRNKPQGVTFQRRPTPCISSKWPKNSMQFTLGMPFLGVLGKFYRNRKWLNKKTITFVCSAVANIIDKNYVCMHYLLHLLCSLMLQT